MCVLYWQVEWWVVQSSFVTRKRERLGVLPPSSRLPRKCKQQEYRNSQAEFRLARLKRIESHLLEELLCRVSVGRSLVVEAKASRY